MTSQICNSCVPNEDYNSQIPECREILSKIPKNMESVIFLGRSGRRNKKVNECNEDSYKPVK